MKLCLHCAVLVSYAVLTLLRPRLFQATTDKNQRRPISFEEKQKFYSGGEKKGKC